MGGVLDASEFGSIDYILYWLINGLFFTCVNCFMLITGYFMCESQMKASRLIKLWMQVLFYSVICTALVMLIQNQWSIKTIAKAFVPLSGEQYWFATHYALILCFIPLLNPLIKSLTKRQYQIGLAILFIVMSFMPTFLVWERDLLTSGRDYSWMIVLYLTGAYIRKYGLNLSGKKCLAGFAVCVLITGLVRTPLGMVSRKLIGSEVLAGLFFRYNSVTVYLGAVLLFNAVLKVRKIRFQNFILNIAPLSFAVYLIHDNPSVRAALWEALPMEKIIAAGIPAALAAMVTTIAVIFIAGCGIEKVRLFIFKVCKIDKIGEIVDKKLFKFLGDSHSENVLKN